MTELDPRANERKLITIASGKGGVGKTWVSVTLAHSLAREGKRVLLFDGDLGLANVDIQLGLMPQRDIGDVIAGEAQLKDVILSYSEPGGKSSFDVIPGKSGSGALGSLARSTLLEVRTGLIDIANEYDHVLLDLAAGIDPSVMALSAHKGRVLVVMTADPTSLTDAYAFIKINIQRNPKLNLAIVVNNVTNNQEGKRAYEAIRRACEGFLKITPPLLGIIKTDKRVVESIRAQTPLLARHPQSEAASNIQALANEIIKG